MSYTSAFTGNYIDNRVGNTIDTLQSKNQEQDTRLDNILNLVWPVGAIYMAMSDTDPSILFGGTWERIANKFLFAMNEGEVAGSAGGSWEHTHTTGDYTLTEAQTPAHTHTRGTMNITGAMTNLAWNNSIGFFGLSTTGAFYNNLTKPSGRLLGEDSYWGAGSDSATLLGFNASNNWTGETSSFGGNQAHNHGSTGSANHTPPYIRVNCWKRIA